MEFLLKSLEDSLKSLNDDTLRTPELSGVFSAFRTHGCIFFRMIKVQSSDVKSLHIMRKSFFPSNPTVGFILRVGIAYMDKMLNEFGPCVEEKLRILKGMMCKEKELSVKETEKSETEGNSEACFPNQKSFLSADLAKHFFPNKVSPIS